MLAILLFTYVVSSFYPAFKDSRSAERGIVRFVIATQIIEAIVLRELVSVVITDRLC